MDLVLVLPSTLLEMLYSGPSIGTVLDSARNGGVCSGPSVDTVLDSARDGGVCSGPR